MAGLIIWLSWIDDGMVWGSRTEVPKESSKFTGRFDCDDVGEGKEYMGCKINMDKKERSITFTKPVLLQSFED
eukprot:2649868-Ditylum_brightwellii.AAC.1